MYKEFVEKIVVKETYVDFYGHINNARYVQMLEEARWEISTRGGLDLIQIKESGIGPVVLGMNIEFRKEVCAREEISIFTKFLNFEHKIGELEQRIIKKNGDLACLALFKIGIWDVKSRKLITAPENWKLAFGYTK